MLDRRLRCVALAAFTFAPMAVAQGLPPVRVPAGNPITADKINLGKVLFWDEQLSSTRTVSCGTCHVPESGGSDPRTLGAGSVHPGPDGQFGTADDIAGSRGVVGHEASGAYRPAAPFDLDVQVTGRKSPSMINAAFHSDTMFWDGRAGGRFADPITTATVLGADAALESQVLEPPVSDVEMAHADRDWNDVAARIATSRPLAVAAAVPAALAAWIGADGYAQLFDRAFGTPDVTPVRIAMAIATYERSLISDAAPIDAFLAGATRALTRQERQGFNLFVGRARCDICHPAPLFARLGNPGPQSEIFFNIGVRPAGEDLGRFVVTGQQGHRGAFKIPSLRNVGLRAPYFHNGGMATLEDVVNFYNRGGDFRQAQTPLIRPLGLSPNERQALVAFLRNALTDSRVAAGLPPFDRPGLYTETGRVPLPYGRGAAGAGGFVPRLIADEPPVLGNPGLTVGLADSRGGAPVAWLFGVQSASGTLAGIPVLVDPLSPMLVLPAGLLAGVGDGNGYASLTMSVPADPRLASGQIYVQALVADTAAPAGLAASAGVELTLFAPR